MKVRKSERRSRRGLTDSRNETESADVEELLEATAGITSEGEAVYEHKGNYEKVRNNRAGERERKNRNSRRIETAERTGTAGKSMVKQKQYRNVRGIWGTEETAGKEGVNQGKERIRTAGEE